jgi:hypothetical protein
MLANIPQIFIKQKVDWTEIITGIEVANTYYNFLSKQDQDAKRTWMETKEESECCARTFCNPRHELKLKVGFPSGPKILEAERPCVWCLQEMTVKDASNGRVLGSFEQDCNDLWGCCGARMHVKDPEGKQIYDIVGPSPFFINCCMQCPCRDPMEFKQVINDAPTGANVQNIPNGCMKMFFTSADDYIITFTEKTSPDERAMILMYAYLLDYMYFQAKQQKNNNNGGVLGAGALSMI